MLTEEQINHYHNLGEYKKICSIFYREDNDSYYYLHPEVVNQNNLTVYICRSCFVSIQNRNIPEYSVANGFEYGDINRISDIIEPLKISEISLISFVRLYGSIIKIMQDDSNIKILKEHMISFLHEGVQVTTNVLNTLPNFDAMYNFKVVFYGNREF